MGGGCIKPIITEGIFNLNMKPIVLMQMAVCLAGGGERLRDFPSSILSSIKLV